MDTNIALQVPGGYYSLYKYISILTDTQIRRLSQIAMGMLSPSDFSEEEISALEEKIKESEHLAH